MTRNYTDDEGAPILQLGQANTRAVLSWAQRQQKEGYLAPVLSSLVVMGCSAGSLGAQIWGSTVLKGMKWSKAAVTPDSFSGLVCCLL